MHEILSGGSEEEDHPPMRRTLLPLLAVLLAGCGLASFASDPGPQRSEDRAVEAVSEVELATSGALTLRTGETPALRITAGRDVLGHLTSEVHGDRLVLGAKGSVGNLGEVRYELGLPAARTVELSGSGSIEAASATALTGIEVSGSGEVRADGLDADELTVALSGSGTITLAGRAGRQTVEIDGSGDYQAADLDSTDADVTIGGSGTADVQVRGTLKAVIEGSGTITHGGGASVQTVIDGSGSVEER
jgi:Putative auto-transporter adhesin, head GIN domain